MRFSLPLLLLPLSLSVACRDGLGACDEMRDVSGPWEFTLTPPALVPMGKTAIPRPTKLTVDLEQQKSNNAFGLGSFVYGSIVSDDKGFFDTLTIPRLLANDGSKTGATLGCRVTLNVPIAMPVTDDNVAQGPLRLSLAGRITAFGAMISQPNLSTVIMVDDATAEARVLEFTAQWMGTVDGGFAPADFGMPAPKREASAESRPTSGRKPAPKAKKKAKKKGRAEKEEPAFAKGEVAMHLVGVDVERRRMVFAFDGLSRAPKANFVTFTDDRGRKFVGVSMDCQEPEGTTRQCEVELPAGYEKRSLASIELHLHGLHGRTARVPTSELSAPPSND